MCKDQWVAMRGVLAAQQSFFVLFASAFFVAFWYKDTAMSAETYGRATDYPALGWATWFFIGHGLAVVGFWRGYPLIAAAGLVFVSLAYLLIAHFSATAVYGAEFALHSFLVGTNLALLNALVAVVFRRQLRHA